VLSIEPGSKCPSFTWAGQHLEPDGIKMLCSKNVLNRNSAEKTISFGPGRLQIKHLAWVLLVDLIFKDTDGGLFKRESLFT
jgi:hypothetical protein